jgi:hypothetical protein
MLLLAVFRLFFLVVVSVQPKKHSNTPIIFFHWRHNNKNIYHTTQHITHHPTHNQPTHTAQNNTTHNQPTHTAQNNTTPHTTTQIITPHPGIKTKQQQQQQQQQQQHTTPPYKTTNNNNSTPRNNQQQQPDHPTNDTTPSSAFLAGNSQSAAAWERKLYDPFSTPRHNTTKQITPHNTTRPNK